MYRKCATGISVLHQKQVTDSLLELIRKMLYGDITVTQLCQAARSPGGSYITCSATRPGHFTHWWSRWPPILKTN